MAAQLRHLHVFSRKHPSSSSSSSTLNSTKLKTLTLIQTVIFSQLYRLAGAVARAKSILLHILGGLEIHLVRQLPIMIITNKNKNNKTTTYDENKKKKLFLGGSFRLHYNWCSSHVVVPAATPPVESVWNLIVAARDGDDEPGGISGYLAWLEEKGGYCVEASAAVNRGGDIDRIADMFIADCHERFRLEKVESDRRFQEMLARGV